MSHRIKTFSEEKEETNNLMEICTTFNCCFQTYNKSNKVKAREKYYVYYSITYPSHYFS